MTTDEGENRTTDSDSAEDADKQRVRVAISLLRDDYDELRRLAQDDGETVASYLRKALATERYLKSRTKSGGRIFVEEDGVQREVVFR
jgi:hypothetical protein